MINIDLLVKTEDFEGPLDLFLHLIDNKKIRYFKNNIYQKLLMNILVL